MITRGEVWWAETANKRRPMLVLSRQGAIPVMQGLLAAPISTTIRGVPTEVQLDQTDGMPETCAISLDNLTVVYKGDLTSRITTLSSIRLAEVCVALRRAVDC